MPYCFVEGARGGCVVVEWTSLIDIQLAVTKELILHFQRMAKIHMPLSDDELELIEFLEDQIRELQPLVDGC